MPQLICASDLIKEAVSVAVKDSDMTAAQQKKELAYWADLPDCEDDRPVMTKGGRKKGRREGPARPLTKYQEFMKSCAKGGAKSFVDCAKDWQHQKE